MSAYNELYQQIKACQLCPELVAGRNLVVPGEGPEDAEIMFIGEAPGVNEDKQGLPFVGAAGGFLNELLKSIGLDRSQVYIANVIKCRPQNNRDPRPEEIDNCNAWLERQIEIIRPRLIVTLGRFSLARFFPGNSIGRVHGTSYEQDGVIYFAMYHPAAALHQNALRQTLLTDMAKIPALLGEDGAATPETATETTTPTTTATPENTEAEPQQLKLL
jgi:uracil-DNA glycosylase family 4